jgi:hypothetical protein
LATAILTANNDFPTELVQSTSSNLLTELGALLNPADLFAA